MKAEAKRLGRDTVQAMRPAAGSIEQTWQDLEKGGIGGREGTATAAAPGAAPGQMMDPEEAKAEAERMKMWQRIATRARESGSAYRKRHKHHKKQPVAAQAAKPAAAKPAAAKPAAAKPAAAAAPTPAKKRF